MIIFLFEGGSTLFEREAVCQVEQGKVLDVFENFGPEFYIGFELTIKSSGKELNGKPANILQVAKGKSGKYDPTGYFVRGCELKVQNCSG